MEDFQNNEQNYDIFTTIWKNYIRTIPSLLAILLYLPIAMVDSSLQSDNRYEKNFADGSATGPILRLWFFIALASLQKSTTSLFGRL
jgi:hypothetical protein